MFLEAFTAMWLICSLIMLGKGVHAWERKNLPGEALLIVLVMMLFGPIGIGITLDRQSRLEDIEEKSIA